MEVGINYNLLGDVIYNSAKENEALDARLEEVAIEMDNAFVLEGDISKHFDEIDKFDYVYHNADAIQDIAKENEVIYDAVALAIGYDNVTEGFVDGVKNASKKVWEFLQKVFQSVKKFVLKVVDFIFGTSYQADYEKKLKQSEETIKQADEVIAPLKGKERVLKLFGFLGFKSKDNDKKAQEVVDQLGDSPDAVEILATAEKEGRLTPEELLILKGIEPVTIDGEESTTVSRLKEAKSNFLSKIGNSKDKASDLVTSLYDNVIKTAGSSLVANLNLNKGTLTQSEKLDLLTKHNDLFKPLTPSEMKRVQGAFVKTVVIGPRGADFTFLTNTKKGNLKSFAIHRPLNDKSDPKKLTFAMQVLYKKMDVKPPFHNKSNAYQHLIDLGASQKELKQAKKWLSTVEVSSVEDIIKTYIDSTDGASISGDDFKDLLNYYRDNKTIMLKAISGYTSSKTTEAKQAKQALKALASKQTTNIPKGADKIFNLINKFNIGNLFNTNNVLNVVKGKDIFKYGSTTFYDLKPKALASITGNGMIVSIMADANHGHKTYFVGEHGVILKVKGKALVPLEDSTGKKVLTEHGPVNKSDVAVKLYKVREISSNLIMSNIATGRGIPPVNAPVRYKLGNVTAPLKNFIGVTGSGADKLRAIIAL